MNNSKCEGSGQAPDANKIATDQSFPNWGRSGCGICSGYYFLTKAQKIPTHKTRTD